MVFGFSLGGGKSKNKYDETAINTVNTPDWWGPRLEEVNNQIAEFGHNYKPSEYANINAPMLGYNAQQMGGYAAGLGNIATSNGATNFINSAINPSVAAIGDEFANIAKGANYSLSGTTPQVNTQTGFTMAQPYRDAYGTEMVDAGLADFDAGVSRAGNAFRAANIGGGAQAAGSKPVAAGVLAADAARGRGSLGAELRSAALDKSFGFGGQDASRQLQGDTFNAGLTQQDRMANLEAQMQGDQMALAARQAQAGQSQRLVDNALAAENQASQNAQNAFNGYSALQDLENTQFDQQLRSQLQAAQLAGIPFDQAMQIFQAQLAGLGAAVPAFGSTTNSSGTSSGSNLGFKFGQTGGK